MHNQNSNLFATSQKCTNENRMKIAIHDCDKYKNKVQGHVHETVCVMCELLKD